MPVTAHSSAIMVAPLSVCKKASSHVVFVFGYLTISLLFLQKIGLNFGGGVLGIGSVVLWIGLVHLTVVGVLKLRLGRCVLFTGFLLAVIGGLFTADDVSKPQSFFVVAMLYSSLIFVVEVDDATRDRCLIFYQKCMIAVGAIVLTQQIVQYTIGSAYWPNIERLLPKTLLVDGYAYIRPYHWRSQYLTPNGVFFLEPSALSTCMGVSLIVETIFFKNPKRFSFYLAALLAGLAVSGIAMVVIAGPFLLFRFNRRLVLGVAVLGLPVLAILFASGLFTNLTARTAELSDKQSSGYARIMVPLASIERFAADSKFTFAGVGPGQSSRRKDDVQWPFSKLLYEYGLLSALAFHLFLISATLIHPPSRILVFAILIPHLFFGGGFVSHVNVVLIVLFCSLLRERQGPDSIERVPAGA